MNAAPAPCGNANDSHPSTLAATELGLLPDFAPIEPWPEPVAGDRLLDALLTLLSRFVIFPEWAAETFALWIVHTYAFRCRSICTYIAVESPEKECGKSTLLTVLGQCVHRPVVSSNITSSAFFRLIEEFNPTLLIDEADINLRGSDELRGILNAGYAKPNAFVWRVAYDSVSESAPDTAPQPAARRRRGQANPGRLARFTCWCPKVIASIGRVHDTLASRCIVIRMHRKTQAEACERLKFLDATALKRQCTRFAADHADAIAAAEPIIPDGLANRAADVWEPLLAIADLAGGRWPDLARKAALALTTTARGRNPIASLLLDILLLFVECEAERIFSRDLVTCLNETPGRPWDELRKGRAIDETWLARQLRPYGIQPITIRIEELQAKGYTYEALKPVFRRYIPPSDVDNYEKEIREAAAPANNPELAEGPAADTPSHGQTEKGAEPRMNANERESPAPGQMERGAEL